MYIAETPIRSGLMLKIRHYILDSLPISSLSFCFLFSFIGIAFSHPQLTADAPVQFQATGIKEARIIIPKFGRYSIIAKSSQGTAVQLVDRMNGPGPIQGQAGKTDGRVDAFLDQAEYKVLMHSDKKGSGNATLMLKPYIEMNPAPVRLVELKDIATTLGDWQKRSYWLEIKKRRWVGIEAAGRYLNKLKLWRDGVWLVDTKEEYDHLEPIKGQPLRSAKMAVELNPGWYLVSFYGGPSEPWANESSAEPLHVRMGIPSVGVAERSLVTVGPLGFNRIRVPGEANYFRIDKMQNKKMVDPKSIRETSISIENFNEERPFRTGFQNIIKHNAVQPMVERVTSDGSKAGWVVTIQGNPGDVVQLQHFKRYNGQQFSLQSPHWVSVLQSGFKQDNIDLTGYFFKKSKHKNEEKVDRKHLLNLTRLHPWERRFNLLEPVSLFFEVKDAGTYRIESKGSQGVYRFEPVNKGPLSKYKAPEYKDVNSDWDLNEGQYELTLKPKGVDKGIITLQIRKKENPFTKWYTDNIAPLLEDKSEVHKRQSYVQYPRYEFDRRNNHRFAFNTRPGVHMGLVIRKLPIDLSSSLPVFQKAGERLKLPVTLPATGTLNARTSNGELLDLSIDGRPPASSVEAGPGPHTLHVLNSAKHEIEYSLVFKRADRSAESPLPEVPDTALASFPEFEKLTASEPKFFDLGRKEKRTFELKVQQPALYRLESSGLMETQGVVRTRTLPTWLSATSNGIGRNFLLGTYLNEGQYQVTVQPQGQSRGHMGLHLTRNKFIDAGPLAEGVPYFQKLEPQTGLIHTLRIAQAGKYRIQTTGQTNKLFVRLEDKDGWPLIKPNRRANVTMHFEPGIYRWLILPKNVTVRLNTLLEKIPKPKKWEGHGPHVISTNKTIRHQWREPEKGNPRTPDTWRFSLPAKARVSFNLSKGIIAELVRDDGNSLLHSDGADRITGNNWKHYLERGDYSLHIRSKGINNQLNYSLLVHTEELLLGQTRRVTSPTKLTLAVGGDSMVHLYGFGKPGIRATLFDDKGNALVQNDELQEDWNFHIIRALPEGRYHLQLEAMGKRNVATEVTLSGFDHEVQRFPVKLEAGIDFKGKSIHSFPVNLPAEGTLWVATAQANSSIGMTLERKNKDGKWEAVTQSISRQPRIAYVSPGESSNAMEHRLRLWPVYKENSSASLRVVNLNSHAIPFTGSGAGIGVHGDITDINHFDLFVAPELEKNMVYGKVKLKSPGIFKAGSGMSDLIVATDIGQALVSDGLPYINAKKEYVWVLGRSSSKSNPQLDLSTLFLNVGKALDVQLSQGHSGMIQVNTNQLKDKSGYLVALAKSHSGQPGVVDNKFAAQAPGFTAHWAEEGHSAIATLPVSDDTEKQSPFFRVWDTQSAGENLPVTLKGFLIEGGMKQTAGMGLTSGVLEKNHSTAFLLPTGQKEIQINVEPGTAILLNQNHVRQQTLWSGEQSQAYDLESGVDEIIILNVNDLPSRFNLLIQPAQASSRAVWNESGAQRNFAHKGTWLLDINPDSASPDSNQEILAGGKGTSLTLITPNGRIIKGDRVPLQTGKLKVSHEGGSVLLNPTAENAQAGDNVQLVKQLPASIPLSGQSVTFEMNSTETRMVHLRTTHPVVVEASGDMEPGPPEIFLHGAQWNRLIVQGTTRITLKSASGTLLEGAAFLYTSAIKSLSEGTGPSTLLAPGDARLYSFKVTDKAPVGVGVKGEEDSPVTLLWSARGRLLGLGVIQMKTLEPGEYFLSVKIPPDGLPIEIQPVVLGIQPQGSGPPASVKQRFLEMVERN